MGAQKNITKNEEEEEKTCCGIIFWGKQWASLFSVEKDILYSLKWKPKSVQNNINQ